MQDHTIRDFILDHGCCLCPQMIAGGSPRVVQLDDGLPVYEAHISCAERAGAVTVQWSAQALQEWCDRRTAAARIYR